MDSIRNNLDVHPAADIFPSMSGDEFDRLVEDIKQHGQINDIELYDGKILDGKHRYRACMKLGIEPKTIGVDFAIKDPIAHVVSLNVHRRHLNESQRAMVAAKLAEIFAADAKDRKKRKPKSVVANLPPQKEKGKSRDKAAKLMKVSGKSVDHAAKVTKQGSKKLAAAVKDGKVAVSAAAKVATNKDHAEQDEWVDEKVAGKATKTKRAGKPTNAATLKLHLPADEPEVRDDDIADGDECVGSTVRDWFASYAAVLSDEDVRVLIAVARETLDRIEAERFGGAGG